MAVAHTSSSFHFKGSDEIIFDHKNVIVAVDLNNGRVAHVDSCSEFLGKIFAGDEILSVNGDSNIKTTPLFNKAVQAAAPGKVKIEFMRDDHCYAEEKQLPERRPNSKLLEVTLKYRGGAACGILVHRMGSHPHTVLISIVQSSSSACNVIKEGDILVKVNDIYVVDRDAARKLLYASINNTKQVVLTLERSSNGTPLGPAPLPPAGAKTSGPVPKAPVATPAAPSTSPAPGAGTASIKAGVVNKQFDVLLPQDVVEIMKKNQEFYKKKITKPSCILKVKLPPPSEPSSMSDNSEVQIPCDPSPKPLKKTPKRVGS